MARRAADRIAEAAERGFVGRVEEIARLCAMAGSDTRPLVVFVRGPGGIGKSRLLQAVAAALPGDVAVTALECSSVEPTPAGMLGAVAAARGVDAADIDAVGETLLAGRRRAVLLLDHYESFVLLDAWLRREFLPRMPAGLLTIAAGRDRPLPGWRTDPGWSDLVEEMELGDLAASDARALLTARGLAPEAAERALRVARGHPLALTLAASAMRSDPALELAGGPPLAVVGELVRRILSGLDDETIVVAEAASTVRRVTEPLLAALLGRESAREPFGRLRDLPFAAQTTHGLVLHDVARDAIAADLRHRDPDRMALLRRRAAAYFGHRVRAAPASALWDLTADLLYLIDHPLVHDAFFSPGAVEHSVEPAGPGDHEEIAGIASRWGDGTEAWLEAWLERLPQAFRVVRDGSGGVAAFFTTAERSWIDPALIARDPVVARIAEHLEQEPLGRGERALIVRRGLSLEHGERPSAALGAAWLDIKRAYLELRPHLRRVYVALTDPRPSAPAIAALGFAPLGAPLPGARPAHVLMLDMGAASVDGWLSALLGAEPPEPPPPPAPPAAPPGPDPLEALSAREREVLALLADGLSNRAIADRLVISPKTAGRHLENVYAKLGVRTRAQAARAAAEGGLTARRPGGRDRMG